VPRLQTCRDVRSASFSSKVVSFSLSVGEKEAPFGEKEAPFGEKEAPFGEKDALRTSLRAHNTTFAGGLIYPSRLQSHFSRCPSGKVALMMRSEREMGSALR